jgi:hypothetical protein
MVELLRPKLARAEELVVEQTNPFSSAQSAVNDLMCRSIKTLHNFEPPATNDEIRASSLQFVRKLCGFTKPSHANEAAFNQAVDEVAHAAQHLLDSLVTNAPPRNREVQSMKARARSRRRFSASNGAVVVAHNHH